MSEVWNVISLTQRSRLFRLERLDSYCFFGSRYAHILAGKLMRVKLVAMDKIVWPCMPDHVVHFEYRRKPASEIDGLSNERVTYHNQIRFLCPARADQRQSMLLDRLPVELIDMVFGILSEAMLDVVFAAMSCQMLWDLGRRHIYAYLEREVADMWWTGHRVLCCEVDLWISEIPDDILSADERAEILNTKNSTYPCLIDHLSAEAPHLSFTHTKLSRDLNGSAYYEERPLDIQHAIKLCHPLQSWGSLEQEDIVWPAHPLILRNITRKQYVQGGEMDDALIKKYPDWRTEDGHLVENFLDLGHVVFSRICWSSEGPLDDPIDCNETPIHQGIWAGDAFDIISAEDPDWERTRSNALWEDVTRAATDDLERMFRSVYIERSLEDIED